jgi:hypothetical protein
LKLFEKQLDMLGKQTVSNVSSRRFKPDALLVAVKTTTIGISTSTRHTAAGTEAG